MAENLANEIRASKGTRAPKDRTDTGRLRDALAHATATDHASTTISTGPSATEIVRRNAGGQFAKHGQPPGQGKKTTIRPSGPKRVKH